VTFNSHSTATLFESARSVAADLLGGDGQDLGLGEAS